MFVFFLLSFICTYIYFVRTYMYVCSLLLYVYLHIFIYYKIISHHRNSIAKATLKRARSVMVCKRRESLKYFFFYGFIISFIFSFLLSFCVFRHFFLLFLQCSFWMQNILKWVVGGFCVWRLSNKDCKLLSTFTSSKK